MEPGYDRQPDFSRPPGPLQSSFCCSELALMWLAVWQGWEPFGGGAVATRTVDVAVGRLQTV